MSIGYTASPFPVNPWFPIASLSGSEKKNWWDIRESSAPPDDPWGVENPGYPLQPLAKSEIESRLDIVWLIERASMYALNNGDNYLSHSHNLLTKGVDK